MNINGLTLTEIRGVTTRLEVSLNAFKVAEAALATLAATVSTNGHKTTRATHKNHPTPQLALDVLKTSGTPLTFGRIRRQLAGHRITKVALYGALSNLSGGKQSTRVAQGTYAAV